MPHSKDQLPEKVCVACGRPFAWRKKWAKAWEQVKYCSQRCQGRGPRPADISLNSAVKSQTKKVT